MSVEQWSDLLFSEAGPRDGHAYGSVRAVNEDGSYMVQLNASNTLTRCAPFCTAMVGDRVKVVINANGKCDAIGRLGGEIGGGGEPAVYSQGDVSDWIAGRVFAYAGTDEPIGSLPCDGRAVSRREYWELFDAIGTTYGAGDGSSTFNLPNIESRTIIGEGTGESGTEYSLGDIGGEEEHKLIIEEMPKHGHPEPRTVWNAASGQIDGYVMIGDYTQTTTQSIGTQGGDQPHNNMPPYIVMRYFITTGKGDPVSGINPADYVVEWGKTDRWSWKKYASGWAECSFVHEYTVPAGYWDSSTLFDGAMAAYTGYSPGEVTYPFTFAKQPYESVIVNSIASGGVNAWLASVSSNTVNGMGTYQLYRGQVSADNGLKVKYSTLVEGWLKEPSASGGTETIAPTIEERFAELEARLAEAEYDTGWENVYVIDSKIEVKVRRVGKMVTLVGTSWGYVTLPAKSWHNITTLNGEFRPSVNVPFIISGMGSFDNELCNSSQIGPDGLVKAYVSKETNYWKFSVSYPVD